MNNVLNLLVALVVVAIYTTEARQFKKCELLNELKKQKITDNTALRNWLCLAQSESSLKSEVVGGPNSNKSYDYGMFQINNKYWCKVGQKGGDCNIKCEDLKDNNIADDIVCAKKIYSRHGFSAWYGWKSKCQSNLPALPSC